MLHYTVKMRATFEDAVAAVKAALEQRGFRVVRSFDLSSALDPDDSACSCPHHGTERCTCRYTVLLVYPTHNDTMSGEVYPCTITVHTRDAETFVTLTRLGHLSAAGRAETIEVERVLVQGLVETSLAIPNGGVGEANS